MDRADNNKLEETNRRQNEYQLLFEESPCYITVQDRDLKLLKYNREFEKIFVPEVGDYCFKAYKGRSERCPNCPVLKTFEDGKPHVSEEQAVTKDGIDTYWLVKTSPIKNEKGEVVAAMEMSLDITHIRFLEKEVERSEEKYRTIFDTIPHPVFVLDSDDLTILDCNERVRGLYGFDKEELLKKSFLMLFEQAEKEKIASKIKSASDIDRVKQIRKTGRAFDSSMHVASANYFGYKVLIVIASDITLRLIAEQHVIQAGKMAILGEMATGIAHELNQPLSVIKTASSFLSRKVIQREAIDSDVLRTLTDEIDSHVDRASRIINHMREFGRKSEVIKERVQVNDVLRRAVDFFRQQLKLRGIEVVEELDRELPLVLAETNRLEQVFINLLLNARDSVEERWEGRNHLAPLKRITLKTSLDEGMITVQITDTGTGVPEGLQDKIFEPFFTTKKIGKGTGLGLSISYGIVRDYDGTIRVTSREGEGATFIIQLPAAREV
jgi:histidine kinase